MADRSKTDRLLGSPTSQARTSLSEKSEKKDESEMKCCDRPYSFLSYSIVEPARILIPAASTRACA